MAKTTIARLSINCLHGNVSCCKSSFVKKKKQNDYQAMHELPLGLQSKVNNHVESFGCNGPSPKISFC